MSNQLLYSSLTTMSPSDIMWYLTVLILEAVAHRHDPPRPPSRVLDALSDKGIQTIVNVKINKVVLGPSGA
jgi:hypothetical protein